MLLSGLPNFIESTMTLRLILCLLLCATQSQGFADAVDAASATVKIAIAQ